MKMKRFVAATLMILVLAGLSACAKTAVCDFCGEEKKCTTTTIINEEYMICEDCEAEMDE